MSFFDRLALMVYFVGASLSLYSISALSLALLCVVLVIGNPIEIRFAKKPVQQQ